MMGGVKQIYVTLFFISNSYLQSFFFQEFLVIFHIAPVNPNS